MEEIILKIIQLNQTKKCFSKHTYWKNVLMINFKIVFFNRASFIRNPNILFLIQKDTHLISCTNSNNVDHSCTLSMYVKIIINTLLIHQASPVSGKNRPWCPRRKLVSPYINRDEERIIYKHYRHWMETICIYTSHNK